MRSREYKVVHGVNTRVIECDKTRLKVCKKCDNNSKIQLDRYTKTLKRLSRIRRGNTL